MGGRLYASFEEDVEGVEVKRKKTNHRSLLTAVYSLRAPLPPNHKIQKGVKSVQHQRRPFSTRTSALTMEQ